MKSFLIFLALLQLTTATVYLTKDDFASQTEGKKALVAFKAPWCTHCKKLKPVWDELADKVDVVVGEVDCTVEKDLCAEHQVQGYPTIKYSTGFGWKKYTKERTLEDFEEFVSKSLVDGCLDDEKLCTEEERKELEEYKQLTTADIHRRLENNQEEAETAEILFNGHVQKLQRKYQTLQEEKEDKLEELQKEETLLRYVLNLNKEEL